MIVDPATRFQLLPDVIDLSFVFTLSGGGAAIATMIAAALRFDPDRLARLVVLGNVIGSAAGILLTGLAAVGVL